MSVFVVQLHPAHRSIRLEAIERRTYRIVGAWTIPLPREIISAITDGAECDVELRFTLDRAEQGPVPERTQP